MPSLDTKALLIVIAIAGNLAHTGKPSKLISIFVACFMFKNYKSCKLNSYKFCNGLFTEYTINENTRCSPAYKIKDYFTFAEAKHACSHNPRCVLVYDISCDGGSFYTCSEDPKPSKKGSCTWVKLNTGIAGNNQSL